MTTMRHHVGRETGPRPFVYTFPADAQDVNLFVLAGSPVSAVNATFTIPSGVWIGSTSAAHAGLKTGGFPAGSVITVINNGNITGKGGQGDGGAAGDAISLDDDVTIDNTFGNILAPGGGGARGLSDDVDYPTYEGGGGGGGGQGFDGGAGGPGIVATRSTGAPGLSGNKSGPGSGGRGGSSGFVLYRRRDGTTVTEKGGNGGAGGGWGSNGSRSGGRASDATSGALIGSAGNAITTNGHAITWLGGNNGTQVVGAVV